MKSSLDSETSPAAVMARLNRKEWLVRGTELYIGQALVRAWHYSHGGSNTATYLHGLYRKSNPLQCLGVAWWIPPTKGAALATYPDNWQGVLALSRLVIHPSVPPNGCSFLLGRSMRLIDRGRWPCLVTYADERQGHTGTIYKATNWTYVGRTKPEATFLLNGRLIARKAGSKTRTRSEMVALGAVNIGNFSKHKFIHVVEKRETHHRF